MIDVAHLQRRAFPGSFSIERLFDGIGRRLADHGVNARKEVAPHFSKRIWPRVQNMRWAGRVGGDVLHVTGDIHYVTMGMPADRTILTIHDLEMLTRTHGIRRGLLKKFWFDLPLRRVAAVTVISEATRQKLLSTVQLDPSIVRVIPNFVDPRFDTSPYPKINRTPRVLLLGTKSNKNLERTILALRGMDCTIDVVGRLSQGQQRALQDSQIQYENHVGVRDDVLIGLYQSCHVLCFASTEEGFGLPIIEAQAIGRPVVTSRCSSMPEVAGEGAHLVDPFDVDSIRDGLETVLGNKLHRERLIAHGFDNCRRFRLDSVVAQYADLYHQVVSNDLTQ